MCPFFLTFPPPPPSFKVVLAGLLLGKVKQYQVLYDTKIKRYREIYLANNVWNAGAKDLDFNENSKSNSILFFMFYQG